MQRDAKVLRLMLQFHCAAAATSQQVEASRSKSSHNWLNSCPLCRAFVPQAFVARADLPTAVCGKCNMIGGSCH